MTSRFVIVSISNDSEASRGIWRPPYRIYWCDWACDHPGYVKYPAFAWSRHERTIYPTAAAAWAVVEAVEKAHIAEEAVRNPHRTANGTEQAYRRQRWGYVVELLPDGFEIQPEDMPAHLRLGKRAP